MSVIETAPFRLPANPSEADILAKYFRGFGEATRLAILACLHEAGELSVREIVESVGASQPQVSNHLACLRWCGFVATRREHRTVYYRIADERVAEILALAQGLLAENEEHVAACQTLDTEAP